MDSDDEGALVIDEDAFSSTGDGNTCDSNATSFSPLKNPLYRPSAAQLGSNNMATTTSLMSPHHLAEHSSGLIGDTLMFNDSPSKTITKFNDSIPSDDFDIYDDEGFISPAPEKPPIPHVNRNRKQVNWGGRKEKDSSPPTPTTHSLNMRQPSVSISSQEDVKPEIISITSVNSVEEERLTIRGNSSLSQPSKSATTPAVEEPNVMIRATTPECPESPPPPASPTEDEDIGMFSTGKVTRVRVEVDEEEQLGGVGFAIDCMGRNDRDDRRGDHGASRDVDYRRREDTDYRVRRDRDEGVDSFDHDPRSRREDSDYRRRDRDPYQNQQYSQSRGYFTSNSSSSPTRREDFERPVYDVEPDVMFNGSNDRRLPQSHPDDSARPKNSCWNCKGDHMITECPDPKDPRRIAMNRKTFMAQKNKHSMNNDGRQGRYHEEHNSQQKFNKYKPGRLSLELRHAMGLKEDEVPLHVYRMRVYGYPPGYLETAMEEATSGLKLYGDNITMAYGSTRRRDTGVNPDNIIAYPGYNSPMPFGQMDLAKELGYPRYSIEDSIETLLVRINESTGGQRDKKCISSKDDGIRSQSSSSEPKPWEYNSLRVVDRPQLNDSARFGIGRGKLIEQAMSQRFSQRKNAMDRNEQMALDQNLIRLARSDENERRRSSAKNKEWTQRSRAEDGVDDRYLPNPGMQKKLKRPHQSSSPSLLRDGGAAFEQEEDEDERSNSPVILNLPPSIIKETPTPTNTSNNTHQTLMAPKDNKTENSAINCGGSDTGSSADFALSPKAKRSKRVEDSDSDIMTVGDDEESDDSVCLLSPGGGDNNPPKKKINSSQRKNKGIVTNRVVDLVELDSPPPDPKAKIHGTETCNRPISPGSSTGDEDMIIESIKRNNEPMKSAPHANAPRQKSCWGNNEENWEEDEDSDKTDDEIPDPTPSPIIRGNERTETQDCHTDKVKTTPIIKEFVPVNPRFAVIKDMLLKSSRDEGDVSSTEPSFRALPSYDKFAQGMPQMVFEEELPERTGRLDKVLSVIKSRKSGESSKT